MDVINKLEINDKINSISRGIEMKKKKKKMRQYSIATGNNNNNNIF